MELWPMKIGICAGAAQWAVVDKSKADFIEMTVAVDLRPEEPREAVMPPLLADAKKFAPQAESYNVFLPGSVKVVGPDADAAQQTAYLDEALSRATELGGAVVVFGSGGSRKIPDSWTLEEARRQTLEFLKRAGDAAQKHGLVIAIEPLNRKECNFINSVAEGTSLAKELGHPAVGVLSDLYHVTEEGQSYDETRDALPWLHHVHVAGQGRRAPIAADHDYLRGFFEVLKAAGYTGRISIECGWQDLPAEAAGSLAVVRNAWDAA